MPSNVGTQTVTLKWLTEAASRKVNERYHKVRPTGIYRGGYLTSVDKNNVTISPLVCEIADDAQGYQVRVETTATVTINEAGGGNELDTLYIVLRWDYTGSSTVDYMALLAVAVGSIRADDLIVGYCSWGGSAYSFDYGRSGYRRSNPKTHEHFLKVEAPDSVAMAGSPMKVRIRGGQIQTSVAAILVDNQPTPSSFTTPASGTEYGLVYVDTAGVVQIVDNDGETSVPAFGGKNVLAIVTITDSDTIITQSMITDVRNFLSNNLLDEDDMTSDSNTQGATQQSIKAYIAAQLKSYGTPTHVRPGGGGNLSQDTWYQANVDGNFYITLETGAAAYQNVYAYMNSSASKTGAVKMINHGVYGRGSCFLQVPAGWWFRGEYSGSAVPELWWQPVA